MLRRLFFIASALALMLALRAVFGAPAVGDRTVLAAIGFVVLAAFTIGDLLKLIGLPRITGYILGGVVLGPQVGHVLTGSIVSDMTVFNTLALGLIALTAGLELEVAAIKKVARTLGVTVAAKIPILLLFVGGGLYAAHRWLGVLDVPSQAHALVVCGIIAVLGIGTSPSIALAVISETGAKGRLSDMTLGIAVVKDVVVVVCLAITIAVGGASLEADAKAVGPVLAHLGIELGASIGIGAVIGVLLILYVKYVGRELLLASVAVVLLVAELALVLHLELLLVFIAAGFVVRNFSHAEHLLLPALTRVSLPIFVVFFATAGAHIDLEATVSVLPVAAGVAVVRALAYFLATRLGTSIGGEAPVIRGHAWYAFLPQAGVTLGLVLLAAKGLPSLADPIHRLGMAMVTIHLLLGPVLLGIALRKAGELPSAGQADALADRVAGRAGTSQDDDRAAGTVRTRERARVHWPDEEPLRAAGERLAGELEAWLERMRAEVIEPGVDGSRRVVARLIAEHKQPGGVLESVRVALSSAPPDPLAELEPRLLSAHQDVRRVIEEGPEAILVDMSEALLSWRPGDRARARVHKRWLRIARFFGADIRRRVPVRICARVASDERMAEVLASAAATWVRVTGEMLRDVGQAVAGERDCDDLWRSLDQRARELVDTLMCDLERAVDEVLLSFAEHLQLSGSPSRPVKNLRLADVEQRARARLDRLRSDARRKAHMRAWFATLHADVIHAQCSARIDEVIEQHVRTPVRIVTEHLAESVRQVMAAMPGPKTETDESLDDQGLADLLAGIDSALDKRSQMRLRGLQMKYYRATQGSAILADVVSVLEGLPEKLSLLDRTVPDAGTDLDRDPALVDIDVTRRLEEELSETFAPDLEDTMRPLGDLVAALDVRVQQAVTVASYGVGVACSSQEAADARTAAALGALERSIRLLEQLIDELLATTERADQGAAEVLARTRSRLDVALGRTAEDHEARASRRRKSLWQRGIERLRPWLGKQATRVIARVRALRRRPDVREWMIRSGHQRLDAAGIRSYLARYAPATHTLDVPPIYAKLFSGESVEDARLATAHRRLLDQLATALEPGKREDFTSVLLSGERGSGRTTLINLVAHRCARRRVVRIDARYHGRSGGVVAAIAEEIGCLHDPASVAAALRRATTIVLVDDLERFLIPGVQGLADLEQFLKLVRESSRYAHWLVSAQTAMVEMFDMLLPLSGSFGRWLTLKPLDGRQLEQAIDNRIRISGLEVTCAERQSRAPWLRREERKRYYKALARQCSGNLRWAMLTHARSTRKIGEEFLARSPRPSGMPFLEHLGAGPIAVLATVVAYGELTQAEIAAGVVLSASQVEAHVNTLQNAGLLCPAPGGAGVIVPIELVDAMAQGLRELGVRPGGVR